METNVNKIIDRTLEVEKVLLSRKSGLTQGQRILVRALLHDMYILAFLDLNNTIGGWQCINSYVLYIIIYYMERMKYKSYEYSFLTKHQKQAIENLEMQSVTFLAITFFIVAVIVTF